MKSNRVFSVSRLLAFLLVVVVLSFMAYPLWAVLASQAPTTAKVVCKMPSQSLSVSSQTSSVVPSLGAQVSASQSPVVHVYSSVLPSQASTPKVVCKMPSQSLSVSSQTSSVVPSLGSQGSTPQGPAVRVCAAEEPSTKVAKAEEIKPKEPIPPEPLGYMDEWKEFTERLSFSGHLNVYYTLSDVEDGDRYDGGGISGLFAPGYKISDRSYFILMYDGYYSKELDFYSDLVGPRETTEFQRHTITPMIRIDFGEKSRYSIVPSFFHTRTYNKDVEGGGWDDGLYNYRDTGGGLDFTARGLGFGGADGILKLGAQLYQREYPNYVSLLDLATGLGVEEDERDYTGVIARAGYNWTQKTGFSWGADYYLLHKGLKDKKVVDSNGVLSSKEQKDYHHNLDLRCWYIPEVNEGLRLGLDLNSGLYRSNQNYYDGVGTLTLADDVFMENFYDYNSYRIRPNISYTFASFPLTASFAYSYQRTNYTDRRAQSSDGTYKDDEQYETQQALSAALRYQLYKNLSIYGQWVHNDVRSNNDYEDVYQYDRTTDNYSLGVSFRF